MKTHKLIAILLVGGLIFVGITGCLRNQSRIFHAGPVVAWKFPHHSNGQGVLLIDNDTTLMLTAQLLAHLQNNDQKFDVSVIDSGNSGAELSKPYNLLSKTVTFPAGKLNAPVKFQVKASEVAAGKEVPLILKLHGNNFAKADSNLSRLHLTIVSSN